MQQHMVATDTRSQTHVGGGGDSTGTGGGLTRTGSGGLFAVGAAGADFCG